MLLISLSFVPFRKYLLPLITGTALTSIPCAAQPIFFKVNSTPYDTQMTRVHAVLMSDSNYSAGQLSISTVNGWINELRAIPYAFSQKWKTPAEVESSADA